MAAPQDCPVYSSSRSPADSFWNLPAEACRLGASQHWRFISTSLRRHTESLVRPGRSAAYRTPDWSSEAGRSNAAAPHARQTTSMMTPNEMVEKKFHLCILRHYMSS